MPQLCFTFLLLHNKYHKFSSLKQRPFVSSLFCKSHAQQDLAGLSALGIMRL